MPCSTCGSILTATQQAAVVKLLDTLPMGRAYYEPRCHQCRGNLSAEIQAAIVALVATFSGSEMARLKEVLFR